MRFLGLTFVKKMITSPTGTLTRKEVVNFSDLHPDFVRALAEIAKISDPEERDYYRANIVDALIPVNPDLARDVLFQVEHPESRFHKFANLALETRREEDLAESERALSELSFSEFAADFRWRHVHVRLILKGDLEGSIRAVQKITDPIIRQGCLLVVIQEGRNNPELITPSLAELIETGERTPNFEALGFTDSFEQMYSGAHASLMSLMAAGTYDRKEQRKKTLLSLIELNAPPVFIRDAALLLIGAGDLETGMRVLVEMFDEQQPFNEDVNHALAKGYAVNGDLAKSRELVAKLSNPVQRSEVFIALAVASLRHN